MVKSCSKLPQPLMCFSGTGIPEMQDTARAKLTHAPSTHELLGLPAETDVAVLLSIAKWGGLSQLLALYLQQPPLYLTGIPSLCATQTTSTSPPRPPRLVCACGSCILPAGAASREGPEQYGDPQGKEPL